MKRRDFHFDLPPELIAQAPLSERSASRLLVLEAPSGRLEDRRFVELPELLRPTDLLILNDTRVLPARLFGRKASGGRVELMLERAIGARQGLFQVRSSRSPKPGAELLLSDHVRARVTARRDDLFEIEFDAPLPAYLEAHGEVPLPPYISRAPAPGDRDRYQTVFARETGAVAAPTAGLHFDDATFVTLDQRGVEYAFLTLHVGAGTFAPLREEQIEAHRLHPERVDVSAALCARIAAARGKGGRVIAVGTTVVRALETAALSGTLEAYRGETQLFIHPGFDFRVVDAMLTNFHLPESSLLMLVAAFAGREQTLAAYRHAVDQHYRFFSYGDAMFVTRQDSEPSRDAF